MGFPFSIPLLFYFIYRKSWRKTYFGSETIDELAIGLGGFAYTTSEKLKKHHYCKYIFGIKNGIVFSADGSNSSSSDCLNVTGGLLKVKKENLSGTDMHGSDFHNSNLNHIQLNDTNLSKVDFSRALLVGANLVGANLREAILSEANLEGANLTQAKMYGANLYRSNLRNVKLLSANLTGANLTDAKLDGAIFCHTIMPDGKENNSGCNN